MNKIRRTIINFIKHEALLHVASNYVFSNPKSWVDHSQDTISDHPGKFASLSNSI